MAMRLFIFFFVFFGKSSFVQSDCKVPPQFWCDDAQISADCGVVEQCKNHQLSNANQPVEFSLYYESLCPDCKQMFENQLGPAYQKIGNIMNIQLVPYGNAREYYDYNRRQWTFYCQHGQEECIGNLIETCVINMYRNVSAFLPFISCMESSSYWPKQAATTCAAEYKMNIEAILACSTSAKGNALEHQMGLKTAALYPRHQYVPWVTVNGVHTQPIQNMAMSDLVRLICMYYTGFPKPAACSQASTVTAVHKKD